MFINTSLQYAILLILSTGKRSFENLGRLIKKSGDTIRRRLIPADESLYIIRKVAQDLFKESYDITISIDDTLIKKIHSQVMIGSGAFFDTKTHRMVKAYRLIAAMVTNGESIIPIEYDFMYAKDTLFPSDEVKSKLYFVEKFFNTTQELFPTKRIVITADGMFASVEVLQWCSDKHIACEMRMHSNRVVVYKGEKTKLSQIKNLQLSGRRMARTIQAFWHNISLYITAEKRIDKHGKETIVFLVSTYQTKPHQHVDRYKKRWPIEKVFRTTKQFLGLQECFSTKLKTQFDHIGNVFLAYTLLQWEMKTKKIKVPEDVIRAFKLKKHKDLMKRFNSLDQIFGDIYA